MLVSKHLTIIIFCYLTSQSACSKNDDTLASAKIELIRSLQSDAYLSSSDVAEIMKKYIQPDDYDAVISNVKHDSYLDQMKSYLSLVNFIKVTAVILFLIAFSSFIANIGSTLVALVFKVPVWMYQASFMSLSCLGTLRPQLFNFSQSFYVALFCTFANLIISSWIIRDYREPIVALVSRYIRLGRIPLEIVMCLCGVAYFSSLAIVHKSTFLGFWAAICLSGVFSFAIHYRPGLLTLSLRREMLQSAIFGHLIILLIHTFVYHGHYFSEYMQFFDAGLHYYCTIGLCVALMCGSSPFGGFCNPLFNAGLFVAIAAFSSYGYFMLDMKISASIIFCFFTLFAMEWIGFFGYRKGVIPGSIMMGICLYGLSLLLEKYSHLIVLYAN